MSESPTPACRITLELCQSPQSRRLMWRCTLKRGKGTVTRTWETENALSSRQLTNLLCDMGTLKATPVEALGEILNALGVAT
jgi:hypothetical protein